MALGLAIARLLRSFREVRPWQRKQLISAAELCLCRRHHSGYNAIDDFLQPKCILTTKAAAALKRVQNKLAPVGLGLKFFDAYRPQRAVDAFVHWAKDLNDARMKDRFYPEVKKMTENIRELLDGSHVQLAGILWCGYTG